MDTVQRYMMKYSLNDIEVWIHVPATSTFPQLLRNPAPWQKFVSQKSYTYAELQNIEKKIVAMITALGYDVCDCMNPLYPEEGRTVITFDIVHQGKNSQKTAARLDEVSPAIFPWLREIVRLSKQEQELLERVFITGSGALQRKQENGMLISLDPQLANIEQSLIMQVSEHAPEIIDLLKESENEYVLQCVQWLPKKTVADREKIYEIIKIANKEGKNAALLALIPAVSLMTEKEKYIVVDMLIDLTLSYPSGHVRNKALSLLADMPVETMLRHSKLQQLRQWVDILSQTKQTNCSYPAELIKKSLA